MTKNEFWWRVNDWDKSEKEREVRVLLQQFLWFKEWLICIVLICEGVPSLGELSLINSYKSFLMSQFFRLVSTYWLTFSCAYGNIVAHFFSAFDIRILVSSGYVSIIHLLRSKLFPRDLPWLYACFEWSNFWIMLTTFRSRLLLILFGAFAC